MAGHNCVICKKTWDSESSDASEGTIWLCPLCHKRYAGLITYKADGGGKNVCTTCRKSRNQECRFTSAQREKVTACSDWTGKNTNSKRWSKFIQD